ncbi:MULTISPECIES: hypothetical protein [Clostridia]|jgi:uncharacterized membrane protein YcjF (UPF0283 family)|uniref:hypothetical protein n=1 Tax=Clostridia TaxID=186801 RepID=UPI0007408907|nr:hypothetical protein [Clostridium sp. C105KSO13]CUX28154.1 hypothetical protein BN3456_01046 [Clostridium sp. C105KSO13]HAX51813.1 hypothetical protein [Lachnospiraceae bacterium]
MRKSNWKSKVLIVFAVLIGIAAGAVAAVTINETHPQITGLAFFGVLAIITIVIVAVGVKILGIGRD